MKTTIEVGDVVVAANGQTTQVLFSGGDRYMCAVCVSVNPFILISQEGDMRWSTKKIEDFVSTGKAPSDVMNICMNRLRRDINSGEVTGVVIEPSHVNLEKAKPVLKSIPVEERKEVWMKTWLAVAGAGGTSSTTSAIHWADTCLEEYIERFGQ
jgi:hypothetical protein